MTEVPTKDRSNTDISTQKQDTNSTIQSWDMNQVDNQTSISEKDPTPSTTKPTEEESNRFIKYFRWFAVLSAVFFMGLVAFASNSSEESCEGKIISDCLTLGDLLVGFAPLFLVGLLITWVVVEVLNKRR